MTRAHPSIPLLAKDMVVVFDLEYTTWDGAKGRNWSGPGEYCEIVQIGAVKLDGVDGYVETGHFQALVKPAINPRLSDYFIDLTGITQQRLDAEGLTFPEAIEAFKAFVETDASTIYSCGGDEKHVYLNCGLNRMSCPIDMRLFRDIMPIFQLALGRGLEAITTAQLPGLLGFANPGSDHDALNDARTTAMALRALDGRVH